MAAPPADMHTRRRPPRAALLMLLLVLATASAAQPPLEGLGRVTSVKGLSQVMYRDMRWGGAYKLLNATGAVGSQGDQNDLLYIDAPLVHVDQLVATGPSRDVVVLVPVAQSVAFFKALLSDPALQARVKGVLVDDTEPPSSYSTLGPFPGAEYAPYAQRDYVWNAAAGGANAFPSALTWLPAPTFLLTPGVAADAASRAAYNAQGSPKQQQYHARLKLTMAAGEASNSSACLAAGSCKPLGGFSVWAAMPPLPRPAPAPAAAAIAAAGDGVGRRPIILVVAQMDSIDMFHDAVQGANAPLSGLVAMLAALQQLKAAAAAGGGSSSSYSSRLVFLALAGEQWGYMGSRRLLYEAATGSNATAGLDVSLVEQVIEVGQVGQLHSSGGGAATLFAHRQRQPGFGDASGMVAALSAAAQGEAAAAQVVLQEASASNPGIPPSSLMSLLRVNASIQGLVVTEFDRGFSNRFYGSRFDNGSRVDAGSIASAAAVLAAGLHRLAGGDPALLQINMTATRSLVDELLACLVLPVPGFACPLAASLMTADYVLSTADGRRSYAPRNYIGVLQYLPEAQSPVGKANLARFVWNFMANATSADDAEGGQAGEACDPLSTPCAGAGQVCMGWRASSKKDPSLLGRCVTASVRFVPSFSTAIACSACADPWQCTWVPSADADAWSAQHAWPRDPAWAESDWPLGVPDLQLYLHESPAVERGVLAAGLVATAVAAAASYAARLAMTRHHAAAVSSWDGAGGGVG